MANEFEIIREVLLSWGLDNGGSPHSWRCEHPDRYGDCNCVDSMTNNIMDAIWGGSDE